MGKAASKRDPFAGVSEHFELGRVVGKGSFGKVFAISRKDTDQLYALKVISKRDVLEKKMVKRIIEEKNILMEIDCPFIVNLRFTFQTKKELCMIVDLMTGGDLRFHLEKEKKFTLDRVKFYAAQIIVAIDYLHSCNIAHRDIKPENILLDNEGCCHLTDFNVSTKFTSDKLMRGIAGTLSYMAPELLKRDPYSPSVDWWSTGIVLYELLLGRTPFSGNKDEKKEQILKYEIRYPDSLPEEFFGLVRGLLSPMNERLAGDEIKRHCFFKDVNWDDVYYRRIQSPFIPLRSKLYIDSKFEVEDMTSNTRDYELSDDEQKLFGDWEFCPDYETFLFKKRDELLNLKQQALGPTALAYSSAPISPLLTTQSNPVLETASHPKKRSRTIGNLMVMRPTNLLGKLTITSRTGTSKNTKKNNPLNSVGTGTVGTGTYEFNHLNSNYRNTLTKMQNPFNVKNAKNNSNVATATTTTTTSTMNQFSGSEPVSHLEMMAQHKFNLLGSGVNNTPDMSSPPLSPSSRGGEGNSEIEDGGTEGFSHGFCGTEDVSDNCSSRH